jgi:FdhD protein
VRPPPFSLDVGEGSRSLPIVRFSADGTVARGERPVAVEAPIAIEFNGIGYAVLMATPADLSDLALGFGFAERVIERAEDVLDVDLHQTDHGILLRMAVTPEAGLRVADRVRHRITDSSCGLCGIENLEQALRPLPTISARSVTTRDAIFTALEQLRGQQALNAATGAAHAAAWCSPDGSIRCVREDVGRHNAFDKLIGAMARAGVDWCGGFALLTSRCSYELVEKAALANCPLLVTISAATSLAVARARECGLPLITLARSDAYLAMTPGTP